MKKYITFLILVLLLSFTTELRSQPSIKEFYIGQKISSKKPSGEKSNYETFEGLSGKITYAYWKHEIWHIYFIPNWEMSIRKFNEFKSAIISHYGVSLLEEETFGDETVEFKTKKGKYYYSLSRTFEPYRGVYKVLFSIQTDFKSVSNPDSNSSDF